MAQSNRRISKETGNKVKCRFRAALSPQGWHIIAKCALILIVLRELHGPAPTRRHRQEDSGRAAGGRPDDQCRACGPGENHRAAVSAPCPGAGEFGLHPRLSCRAERWRTRL